MEWERQNGYNIGPPGLFSRVVRAWIAEIDDWPHWVTVKWRQNIYYVSLWRCVPAPPVEQLEVLWLRETPDAAEALAWAEHAKACPEAAILEGVL